MADKYVSQKVLVGPFRASYPYLFEKDKNDKYSLCCLLPPGYDLSPIKAAINDVLVQRFGPDKKKWPTGLKMPLHSQDERAEKGQAGYQEGGTYFNCWSFSQPEIIDHKRQEIIDNDAIYPGVWLRAMVTAFWFDNSGNKGVSFFLGNVQKVRDDARIDSRVKAAAEFDDVPYDGGDTSSSADSLYD